MTETIGAHPFAYDEQVVIIGAGPGGSTTSMVLSDHGVSHLLIDKAVFPRDKVCGDALSGKVMSVLKRLRAESANEMLGNKENFLGSYGVKFVAPNGKSLEIPFKQNNEQSNPPGYVSPRLAFDNYLYQKTESAFAKRLCGVTIKKVTREASYIILECVSNNEVIYIRTRLVIGAEGERSAVARDLGGFKKNPESYCAGLRAYYKNVSGMHQNNFIELHFLKEALPGYFWIFPMAGGMANVGLGMLSSKVSKNKVNLKSLFANLIEHHKEIRPRFEHAQLLSPVQGWGLPLGNRRRPLSGAGYMLVGDAGSLIDPFTGEGISNAMISGVKAGEMAVKCVSEKDYSSALLKQYDEAVYSRLWSELKLSSTLQKMVEVPWLFNIIANKAEKNKVLEETLMCMFDDIELRSRLTNPLFYFKLLFG